MMRRPIFVCLLAGALLLPYFSRAEQTRYWRQTDRSEFEKGTAKGVAIRNDGKLMPAPKFELFGDPDLAYLWELRMDSRGRLYAAGGPDAKVLRFDSAGKPTTVFESPELAAQAIVFDSKDNLYVGTSPDGKVYKVTPDGQKSVFFDPKTKYIWALAMDSQGSLFVATGDKGETFVVSPDGKGRLFYQSEERHARTLAFDARGNLLVGTEPSGLILRVEVERKGAGGIPTAGASFVIYETNKGEVTSLLSDSKGNLFAASVGEKVRIQGVPRGVPGTTPPTIGGQPLIVPQGQSATAQPPTTYPFPVATGGAEVVKIAPDGSPETLWTSRDELVYAMGLTPSGTLLIGTGDKGSIIELEGDQTYSTVAKSESAQVTSLLPGEGGKIFAATANAGKVFTLGPGYDSNGSFESDAFDAKIFSHWGRLTWWGENGAMKDRVAFYARSGNTSRPDKNWSPWVGPYKSSGGTEVGSPASRFVQWKLVFLDVDNGPLPAVSWVSLAYQPKNVAPVIDDIALQDPGIRIVGFAQQPSGPGTSAPVLLRTPRGPGADSSPVVPMGGDAASRAAKVEMPPQGFAGRGYRSVLWSAHDDNDDDLVYSIYYRGEGEQNWRLLKDKLTPRYYSWDTTSMPDGAYYLKIVASDSPSNPADQAFSTERQSDRFEVANTPPRIEALRADANSPSVKVSFDGVSSTDAIARAQYSLDSGDWQVILPVGQLSDAPKESYRIDIPNISPGEHTIAVEVTDRFDNTTADKVTFVAPGPRASK